MADAFDPYYTWLAIPKAEQPPDHYRLLGLPRYEENLDVISNAMDQRSAYLRTLQTGKHAVESQRLLNEVAAAAGCLLNRERKSAYDIQLREQETLRARLAAAMPLGVGGRASLKPHTPPPCCHGLKVSPSSCRPFLPQRRTCPAAAEHVADRGGDCRAGCSRDPCCRRAGGSAATANPWSKT
jgi:hypothetical protein